MHITLTVKFAASSKGELIDSFATEVLEAKAALEGFIAKEGFLGLPPEKVDLRVLVVGGRWEDSNG